MNPDRALALKAAETSHKRDASRQEWVATVLAGWFAVLREEGLRPADINYYELATKLYEAIDHRLEDARRLQK